METSLIRLEVVRILNWGGSFEQSQWTKRKAAFNAETAESKERSMDLQIKDYLKTNSSWLLNSYVLGHGLLGCIARLAREYNREYNKVLAQRSIPYSSRNQSIAAGGEAKFYRLVSSRAAKIQNRNRGKIFKKCM